MNSGFRSVSWVNPHAPMPAPRAKLTRTGLMYYPKLYTVWRGDTMVHVPAMVPLLDVPVAIALDHVCPPYKTVTTQWARGDIDNFAKAILDVITKSKRIWKDDMQVTFMIERKRFAIIGEKPHTAIYIREV